jgi:hypothetical protein
MARLAWIAPEVGSAAGFPNGNIILQKLRPNEGPRLTLGKAGRQVVVMWEPASGPLNSDRAYRPPVLVEEATCRRSTTVPVPAYK